MPADPTLAEEDGASILDLDQQPNEQEQGPKQAQASRGPKQVKNSL